MRDIQQRISEMGIDCFPLDRMLPLHTVHYLFHSAYGKSDSKALFFKKREYQRLREGYYSMFVVASLNDLTKKVYCVSFPSSPSNDFDIIELNDSPRLNTFNFDLKEYTSYSSSFKQFIKQVIEKIKTRSYNIVIAISKDILGKDLLCLCNKIKEMSISQKIWVITAPEDNVQDNPDSARVIVIDKTGVIYEKELNLHHFIDKKTPPLIYQDILKYR